MPFLDREQELAWLSDAWPPTSRGPQLRILYGRRRVGKSALLDAFAHGKRCVVFQAVEGTVADQLRDLTTALLACEDDLGAARRSPYYLGRRSRVSDPHGQSRITARHLR